MRRLKPSSPKMQSSSVLKFVVLRNRTSPILKISSVSVISGRIQRCQSSVAGGATSTKSSPSKAGIENLPTFTSTPEGVSKASGDDQSKGTISKAMHAYLKRAQEHQEFMANQEKEFVFGRRHLANMMGKDPETFTQKDIDEAIRYLFPCGLYHPLAKPLMRPPTEVYPKQKAAQFDMSGRPHHPFFYTSKPNFYYMLHEMVGKLNSLNKIASSRSDTDLSSDSSLGGSVWLTKEELEQRLLEKLTDQMYNEFVACIERLASHPKKEKEIEFIKSYRKPLAVQGKVDELPPVTLEPDGRKSVHIPVCMRKNTRADVIVTVPGTGEFKINGKGLDHFKTIPPRLTVIAPLQLVGWLGKCDVEANVMVGGSPPVSENLKYMKDWTETSQAGAVRYGIGNALAALGADMEKLRLAGYLMLDRRTKERKKPGRDGARAKWTWKKR